MSSSNDDLKDTCLHHAIREVPPIGGETIFEVADGPDGAKHVTISHKQLNPDEPRYDQRPIARAQARAHVFNNITAFAEYLKREGNPEETLILADIGAQCIKAVLNDVDSHDREIVEFRTLVHPLFEPWSGLLGKSIGVTDFALFCMKNRRAVVKPDGRETALTFQQIKMSKAITVHKGEGKKTLNGVIVEIEIAGVRKETAVELPEMLTIEVPLYVDTPPMAVEIDLLVTARGDDVIVYATAGDVEAQRIVAFDQMVKRLADESGMLVGLGRIEQRNWDTIAPVR